MNKALIRFVFLLGVVPVLSACAMVAGTFDSIRRVGITAADRERLLPQAVKQFQDNLGWQDISRALTFATEEYRVELRDTLMKTKDSVRTVESGVDLVEFENDSYEASVFLTIKSYSIGYYVIEPHKEKQRWTFSLSDGWKISHRDAL